MYSEGSEWVLYHVGNRLRFNVTETDEGFKAEAIELADQHDIDDLDSTFASERPQWGQSN